MAAICAALAFLFTLAVFMPTAEVRTAPAPAARSSR